MHDPEVTSKYKIEDMEHSKYHVQCCSDQTGPAQSTKQMVTRRKKRLLLMKDGIKCNWICTGSIENRRGVESCRTCCLANEVPMGGKRFEDMSWMAGQGIC